MKRTLAAIVFSLGAASFGRCGLPDAPKGDYSVKLDDIYSCESDGTNQTNLIEIDDVIGIKLKTIPDGNVAYGSDPLYDPAGELNTLNVVVDERCEQMKDINPENYTPSKLKEAKRVCYLIGRCNEKLKEKYNLNFF